MKNSKKIQKNKMPFSNNVKKYFNEKSKKIKNSAEIEGTENSVKNMI